MGGKEIEGKLVTESTSILDSRPPTTLISKGTSFIKVNYYMLRKVAVHNPFLFTNTFEVNYLMVDDKPKG